MGIDTTNNPNLRIGGAFRTPGRDNDQIGKEARGFNSIKNPIEGELHRVTGSVERTSTEPPKASDNKSVDPVLAIGGAFRTPGGSTQLLGADARGYHNSASPVARQAHKLTGSVQREPAPEIPASTPVEQPEKSEQSEKFGSEAEAFVSTVSSSAPAPEQADIESIERPQFLSAHDGAEEEAENQFG